MQATRSHWRKPGVCCPAVLTCDVLARSKRVCDVSDLVQFPKPGLLVVALDMPLHPTFRSVLAVFNLKSQTSVYLKWLDATPRSGRLVATARSKGGLTHTC